MERLAEIFGHDFDDGKFKLFDKDGNIVYCEYSNGYWAKRKFDKDGKEIYYENSDGYWAKCEYDKNGNEIYYESSSGYWSKREYNKNNNQIYYENSDGTIRDIRPKTIDKEIIIDGKKYQLVENKT